MTKVLVIGAGPAGMMAAIAAAEQGAQVMLLEKNDRIGKKLMITGKGRCNVTSNKEVQEIISQFGHNGKFLYTAFAKYSNRNLMDFFEGEGVPLKVERGDRVFPESDQAKDIVNALRRKMDALGIDLWLNAPVKEVIADENKVVGVVLPNRKTIEADAVIIATGGLSYPGTGSTGDGYHFATKTGHSIVTPRASLIPLVCGEEWIKQLQGLSLKNVTLKISDMNGKKIAEEFGEMLFTHFGISGPIVLSESFKVVDFWQKRKEPVKGSIDFKPALTREKLDARILREIEEQNKKQLKNSLHTLMPTKLIPVFLQQTGINGDKEMHQITREERLKMVDTLKDFQFTITGARPVEEAIVTAGGVSIKEISPKTMESKLIKGLYFCGEVMDIDAQTGGFNLQAAFSTGYLAGIAAATQDEE